MRKATKDKITKLREMAGKAGSSVLERLTLVESLLKDADYLALYGDDLAKAEASASNEFFPDLDGWVGLGRLVDVVRRFPDEGTWKEYRYNLRAMVDLFDQQRDDERPERPIRRTVKVADFEDLQTEKADVEYALKREREASRQKDCEAAELRRQLVERDREIERLRGRIEELERIVDGRFAAA